MPASAFSIAMCAAFCAYAFASLFVATDEFLGLDLVPSPEQTYMSERISRFAAEDAPDFSDVEYSIVNRWSEMSVPHLVDALESDNPSVRRRSAECLYQITDQNIGEDPVLWRKYLSEDAQDGLDK